MTLYVLALYFIFGLIPSLIWLFYYLLKDLHPEPKKKIFKVFLVGALSAVPALFVQIGLTEVLLNVQGFINVNIPSISGYFPTIANLLKWFIIIALTEELFKYLVVRWLVYKDSVLDEPLDIMLYMVVSALGFSALENMLFLFSPFVGIPLSTILSMTITLSFIRFIGATFLHTLCSALLGYFLVKALYDPHKRLKFTIMGILLATLLHGFYDFSIITLSTPFNLALPVVIVLFLALFMLYDFDEVRKLKGICKL